MSQKAAASLSSSLFARKGKASPASLLISELEVGSAAAGRPAANGSVRRKPKREAELPLLAYVEALDGKEPESSGAGDRDAQTIAAKAEDEPTSPMKPELAPAASLLERGAKPLRRTNGRGTGMPVATPAPPPPAGEDAAQEAPGASPESGAEDETLEAETVSGDANVAAIEDASDEETVAPSGEVAPATQDIAASAAKTGEAVAAEPGTVVAPAAAAVSVVSDGAVASDEPPVIVEPAVATDSAAVARDPATVIVVPAQESKPEPESKPNPESNPESRPAAAARAEAAIAASVALRRAKSLQGDPALSGTGAPPLADTAPRPRVAGQPSRSYLWRGAALVALGAVAGFGAYLLATGKPVDPPVVVEAALPPQPVPDAASPETVAAPPAAAPVEAAPVSPPAEEGATASPAPPPALPEPSFDIIRIEPDGQSIIAGRAEPFSEWILLNNGTPIAAVKADANGEWVVLPDASLVPGANAFSLVPKTERGKVAIPAPGSAPAATQSQSKPANEAEAPPVSGQEGGAVEGALQDAESSPRAAAGLALPKPKPAPGQTRALPARLQLSPDGAYVVQLASVRQTADASRERARLAAAFPDLLGDLDLRVQEAAVEGAGTFYRVRSGAIADLGLAREICRRLEAGGQGCLVVRRAAETSEPVTEVVEEAPAEPAASAAGQQAERPQ